MCFYSLNHFDTLPLFTLQVCINIFLKNSQAASMLVGEFVVLSPSQSVRWQKSAYLALQYYVCGCSRKSAEPKNVNMNLCIVTWLVLLEYFFLFKTQIYKYKGIMFSKSATQETDWPYSTEKRKIAAP